MQKCFSLAHSKYRKKRNKTDTWIGIAVMPVVVITIIVNVLLKFMNELWFDVSGMRCR